MFSVFTLARLFLLGHKDAKNGSKLNTCHKHTFGCKMGVNELENYLKLKRRNMQKTEPAM